MSCLHRINCHNHWMKALTSILTFNSYQQPLTETHHDWIESWDSYGLFASNMHSGICSPTTSCVTKDKERNSQASGSATVPGSPRSRGRFDCKQNNRYWPKHISLALRASSFTRTFVTTFFNSLLHQLISVGIFELGKGEK